MREVRVGHIQPQHHQSVFVAGRVPEHVGMQLEAKIGHEADSFHYGGEDWHHSLIGRETRELRQHQRESPHNRLSSSSERGSPLSAPGFSP
jgi:hypothetical protein